MNPKRGFELISLRERVRDMWDVKHPSDSTKTKAQQKLGSLLAGF